MHTSRPGISSDGSTTIFTAKHGHRLFTRDCHPYPNFSLTKVYTSQISGFSGVFQSKRE